MGMTKDQWTELQTLLRQYKAAEKALDRLAAKAEAVRRVRDGLAAKVREMMPEGG